MKIKIGVSNHHVHLTHEALEVLFGKDYELTKKRDLVQKGQTGMTMRTLEALFFKKKIITNNLMLVQSPIYNSNNIFIIGYNNWNDFKEIWNLPYIEYDVATLKYYSVDSWIERF